MTTRREFLGASAAILGASAAGASAAIDPAGEKLDILFLGGTGFIGPHQVNYALARGHKVTVFNRGRQAGLYGDKVEELVGNRDAKVDDGLKALEGKRSWDVVIDNSGYIPRHVRDSAELLEARCGRYVYTSTLSVYDLDKVQTVDVSSPLYAPLDSSVEQVTGETYGPLKAECDRIVQQVCGDKATIVRPTYIVGPGDRTDRFTYWVERFQRGGDVLCPADPGQNIDWIDARDLCHWMIRLGESDTAGIYNGTGPGQHISREHFMWALRLSSPKKSHLHWPSRELLEKTGFPTPMAANSEHSYFFDPSTSEAAGLTYRSLADTVRDTHDWWMSQTEERRAVPSSRAAADYRRWASEEEEAAVIAQVG
jgi:2'-hydroxyisoflavone reductase